MSPANGSLSMRWLFPDGAPWGVQCVAGGLCRAHVHLLFAVALAQPLDRLVGGARFAIERGGAYDASAIATFETHILPLSSLGEDGGSQVWTVQYDALLPPGVFGSDCPRWAAALRAVC